MPDKKPDKNKLTDEKLEKVNGGVEVTELTDQPTPNGMLATPGENSSPAPSVPQKTGRRRY